MDTEVILYHLFAGAGGKGLSCRQTGSLSSKSGRGRSGVTRLPVNHFPILYSLIFTMLLLLFALLFHCCF